MTKTFSAIAGLILAAAATPAFAQDEDASGPITVSGGVTLVSDYRFRGLSYTDNDFAIQPTLTVSHESGAYVGVWGSNLEDSALYGEFEVDLYAGYATEIAPGTTIDLGLTYYIYPDGSSAAGNSDYFEPALKLGYEIGPVTATTTLAYAWSQSSLGNDDSIYLGLGLSGAIPNTPVTLVGSVGYADGSLALVSPSGSYLDWSLGADVAVGPATIGVRYIDTDVPATGVKAVDKLYDAGVLFSIGFTF